MQDSGRDSKPGCGPKNVTENGQPVPTWYAAKRCTECGHMGGWHTLGCAAKVIDMAQLEPGVYRAILDDLFAA